jgi:hypothetical protein
MEFGVDFPTKTMIIVINAHNAKKLTFQGGVLQHMLLLLLDKYGQAKHIGHHPCMWEDANALNLIAAAAWTPVWVGGFSAMVCSNAGALMCP